MAETPTHVTVHIDLTPFNEAMARALEAIRKFTEHWTVDARGRLRRVDVHHPRPLAINGAAYRRRSRARTRRRR